jgi:hypothetical protein
VRVTIRLPYEDPETGLRDRVYEKDFELAEVPAVGELCPPLKEIGFPTGRIVERVAQDGDVWVVWVAASSGFASTTFGEKRRLDDRLLRFGWRRVRHGG